MSIWKRLAGATVLLLCLQFPFSNAHAQLSTWGEFGLSGGRLREQNQYYSNLFIASGNFGVQYGIVSLNIGAGPSYTLPDGKTRGNGTFSDYLGLALNGGLQLRIPFEKNLLVTGCDYSIVGFTPHLGILFPGSWNYRGFFVHASFDPGHNKDTYFGLGFKMTLTHF